MPQARIHRALSGIPARQWDALHDGRNPFVAHAFLAGMEAHGVIDARLLLRTDDDALIYVSYGGRLDVSNPAAGMVAYVAPVFETSDERYSWLNGVQAVGKGVFGKSGSVTTITYELFEVR